MSMLLRNVSVLPMRRENILKERDVLIENGRITRTKRGKERAAGTTDNGRRKLFHCGEKGLGEELP